MEHALKTWPDYFNALLDGLKTFEVRKADRDFQVGDTLVLLEFVPPCGHWQQDHFTGRELRRTVTYVLREPSPFAFPGFVVMGLSQDLDAAEEYWTNLADECGFTPGASTTKEEFVALVRHTINEAQEGYEH